MFRSGIECELNAKLGKKIGLEYANTGFLFKSLFDEDGKLFKMIFEEYIFKINQQHRVHTAASRNCGQIINLILKN